MDGLPPFFSRERAGGAFRFRPMLRAKKIAGLLQSAQAPTPSRSRFGNTLQTFCIRATRGGLGQDPVREPEEHVPVGEECVAGDERTALDEYADGD